MTSNLVYSILMTSCFSKNKLSIELKLISGDIDKKRNLKISPISLALNKYLYDHLILQN